MLAVTIQDDMGRVAAMLPDGQRLEFLGTLVAYGLYREEPEPDKPYAILFEAFRERLDMSRESFENGRKGAAKRKANRERKTPSEPPYATPLPYPPTAEGYLTENENETENETERTGCAGDARIAERREIVGHLNDVCGTRFKEGTPKTRRLIAARMREGFTVEDFARVVDAKAAQWLGDPSMRRYLRPETLFGTKFEGYLNEARSGGGPRDRSEYDF